VPLCAALTGRGVLVTMTGAPVAACTGFGCGIDAMATATIRTPAHAGTIRLTVMGVLRGRQIYEPTNTDAYRMFIWFRIDR
jgi:hypothetical protein